MVVDADGQLCWQRDRHRQDGAKPDRGDTSVLADLVHTDRHTHHPAAGDSPQVEGIKIMARTHQNILLALDSDSEGCQRHRGGLEAA